MAVRRGANAERVEMMGDWDYEGHDVGGQVKPYWALTSGINVTRLDAAARAESASKRLRQREKFAH